MSDAVRFLAAFLLITATLTPGRAAPAGESPSDYCGEYFLPSGERVSVFEQGVVASLRRLTFIDWENGRTGALVAGDADQFSAPLSPGTPGGPATALTFERDAGGRVVALRIREPGAGERRAGRRETFVEAAVGFSNGNVALAGTLKTPRGEGPFPAVVLVHGSGPGERTQLESAARYFAGAGLAVLSYDKRGCGGSRGDWKTVDLEVLAGDAVAAVAFLQGRPEIDARRVGIWGISQGGWIGPLAAAQSERVAFVINHSGPGTSLRRQDVYMTANLLEQAGIPAEDIVLALRALDTVYDYGRGRATAAAVDEAVDALAGKEGLEDFASLRAAALIPDSLYARQTIGDPAWFFHLDPDRDAAAPYRTLRCPLLVVYGRLDYTVPVQESVEKITEALRASGHADFTVRVLDRTGHGPLVMRSDAPQLPAVPMSVATEYYALLGEWLRARGFAGDPGAAP